MVPLLALKADPKRHNTQSYRRTIKQTDRQAGRQTDRQTDRETDRQTDIMSTIGQNFCRRPTNIYV